MKDHRLIIVGKAPCVVPASPTPAIASTSERRRYERWAALGIAAATLAISVIISNAPAAAGAAKGRLRDGAMAPWEKTAGPPGIQTNVIFEANNTVYAGTETITAADLETIKNIFTVFTFEILGLKHKEVTGQPATVQ